MTTKRSQDHRPNTWLSMGVIALCALASLQDASALQPPSNTHLGMEPLRMQVQHPRVQAAFTSAERWQDFLAADGRDWRARFDEVTGTPHRMWGPGLFYGELHSRQDVTEAAVRFTRDHTELLGLEGANLRLHSAERDPASSAWYVEVDVLRDGLPIWRGGLSYRFKKDKLVMVGADTYPNTPIVNALRLSREDAMVQGMLVGPAPMADHTDLSAKAWLLPQVVGGKVELRAVWEIRSKTVQPLGHWVTFIDGTTGELVNAHNEIRFASGQITAQHDQRLGGGGLTVSPLPFATLSNGGQSVFTSANGDHTIATASSYTVSLNGSRVRILDQQGTITPTITSATARLDSSDFGGRLAPLTTYVYTHGAQDWARNYAPEVSFATAKVNAYVNINDVCNAYFDGDINFFQAGSGCRNTGRLADVIYHEWGHGFHLHSLLGGVYDGSIGEGAADTLAFLITDDPRIAPNFFIGGGTLRNVNNNATWPGDFTNNDAYVHANGLIFGGSMWDTREALRRDFGEPYATDTTSAIFKGLLKGGPDVESSFDEAMFADDDDGNLANGTPHLCQLIEGFGAHGLGTGVSGVSEAIHTPVARVAPGQTITLRAESSANSCSAGTGATGGTAHFRVNGGAWSTRNMSRAGDTVRATLPAFEMGDIVEYWLEVDSSGSTSFSPAGGEINPHTLYVGDVIRVHCDDFEAHDGGFTHSLVSGTADSGADDWLWGTPYGQAGDAGRAFSGTKIWGTDLGEVGWNGEYQDDKRTRLQSPNYELAHFTDVFLGYRRWLTIEDGLYDRATIYADGQLVWSNWATNSTRGAEHHIDRAWAAHVVDLGHTVDDGRVQIRWEIQSDGGLTFGGWNIDDVCMFAPATPDNRLGINDLDATGLANGNVRLNWTNPAGKPLAQIQIVRRTDRFPDGPTDGTVVLETVDATTGEPATFTDRTANGQPDLYYAIYAFDGDQWLSWTIDGFNAAYLP